MTASSQRPGKVSIVFVAAVLGLLLVAVMLFRQEHTTPITVVRSPQLPLGLLLPDLNTLKAAAISAQSAQNLTGTVTHEEVVVLTLGQWLTLNEGDISFALPQPRWTPLYVITRHGSFHYDDAPDAPPFNALMIVLSATTAELLEYRTFADGDDIFVVDAAIEDDGTRNPVVPTAPRDVEPGSA